MGKSKKSNRTKTPWQPATDAEMAILEFLWTHGESTVRAIAAGVYPPGDAQQQATVQKLLHRLEDKGHIRRDRSSFVHHIGVVIDRGEFVGRQMRDLAERLSSGSIVPALLQMVEQTPLNKKERDRLRRWLDDAEELRKRNL